MRSSTVSQAPRVQNLPMDDAPTGDFAALSRNTARVQRYREAGRRMGESIRPTMVKAALASGAASVMTASSWINPLGSIPIFPTPDGDCVLFGDIGLPHKIPCPKEIGQGQRHDALGAVAAITAASTVLCGGLAASAPLVGEKLGAAAAHTANALGAAAGYLAGERTASPEEEQRLLV